ncbi:MULTISPECIES: sigma-54-dependent Fis family transcriptional regulator [Pseudomonas]|uniref:sigma-54-dependent Fis family transcriptional regulator n=1 Tax=Pseudomonas TaxID=286 RepID=UPI0015731AC0|nr:MULTISPECIES: sigma-54-dependent Fis family transcriptional regulator [Pseudomonas]MBG6127971.1 transcriptional regulator of acetoin/glycerol metabolism [Pseudomonas sp. M2]MBM7396096.1 transcriptional regulator of acetoin/glycerol metabolism [Pseudomonas sp. M5]NSX19028.1 sigma-54-dependent Fis family transcriptional regulator [Pseudomonas putida]HDS1743850.1 sigma-54-dependent Fis family transcriptional regulator [Pseudomonas putida]HDS1755218.1 sigma-54-dependent Fis family transcription
MAAHTASPHASELAAFVDCHFAERGLMPEPVIAESWYRSINQHHLDPELRHVDNILSAAEIRQHQAQHEAYLAIASQGVSGLARRVVDAGFAVLLSDAEGITLDARLPADPQRYTRSGLIVGARWDESVAGTNGIGTALASRQALTIHRQEHFLAANARLSCSVSPIFDAHNQLLGCLNATCLYNDGPKQAQHLTLQLVTLYARLIENSHFRERFRDRLTLALKPRDEFSDLAAEQLLALDEGGRVIGANRAAFLAHSGKLLGAPVEQLLHADIDQLLDLTRGGARGTQLRAHAQALLLDVGLRVPAGYRPLPAVPPMPARARHPGLEQLAGQDAQLQQSVRRLRKVLDKDIAILLDGETGTGKEAFARALHQASQRHAKPFVALNCAAIPESLIESELFGYRAGSFTGASRKGMKGKLEHANGGTLFLDEIGDMPAHLQTRLLRVLAERELVPLGAETPVALDIQVISATHQDLQAMIGEKRFREDLYYRLCGMRMRLPALRERSDRRELIDALLSGLSAGSGLRLSAEAHRCLLGHAWPGNVRQLLNALRQAVALAEGGVIELADLPQELLDGAAPAQPAALEQQVEDLQARHLLEVLKREHWNMSAAAQALGISRSTLYRKMKRYAIVQPNLLG